MRFESSSPDYLNGRTVVLIGFCFDVVRGFPPTVFRQWAVFFYLC